MEKCISSLINTLTHDTIIQLPFDMALNIFGELYAKDYGELKAKEIAGKIHTSPKINNLIRRCELENVNITSIAITSTLNTIPYFMFSKAETLCLASLVALDKWNHTCNIITENSKVKHILYNIVVETARLKTSNPDNFFTRLYKIIDKAGFEYKQHLINDAQKQSEIKQAEEDKAAKIAMAKEIKHQKELKKYELKTTL